MSGGTSGRLLPRLVPVQVLQDIEKRFTGFPVPQGLFDPSTASPQLLRKYGLPPKPMQPLLRETWNKGFGKPLQLQAFKVHANLVEDTQYRLYRDQVAEMSFEGNHIETSSNWSGAYITANQDRRFLQIWGYWTIPNSLELPPAPMQGPADIPYVCANWIGLDGQRLYLNSSLPQMGTVAIRQNDGTTTAQSWMQWWARFSASSAPVPIGLAVNPGDQIFCVLTAWDPQTVIGVMINLSTGTGTVAQATSPTVTLPDGSTVQPSIAGATAEWILERPRVVGQTTIYNFPNYGETEFDFCVAVESDEVDIFSLFSGIPQQLQGARRIRMFQTLTDPARTAYISMPRKLNNAAIRVKYGGFG